MLNKNAAWLTAASLLFMTACSNMDKEQPTTVVLEQQQMVADSEEDEVQTAIQRKIDTYTRSAFRHWTDISVSNTEGPTSVSVTLLPEGESETATSQLLRTIAVHAVDILKFFPEVESFHYHIVKDDQEKNEVMSVTLEGEQTKQISNAYNEQLRNEQAGLPADYRALFTQVTENSPAAGWN